MQVTVPLYNIIWLIYLYKCIKKFTFEKSVLVLYHWSSSAFSCSDYPMMLSLFSNLLVRESDRRVIDNLCAALCRMIMSHTEGVPLEQVLEYGMLARFKTSVTVLGWDRAHLKLCTHYRSKVCGHPTEMFLMILQAFWSEGVWVNVWNRHINFFC